MNCFPVHIQLFYRLNIKHHSCLNLKKKKSAFEKQNIRFFFNSLSEKKKNLIDLVIDAGTLPRNKPSTVVDMTKEKIKILRRGDVGLQENKVNISNSENETKRIAKNILRNISKEKNTKAIAFIIRGELGAGKTIFV